MHHLLSRTLPVLRPRILSPATTFTAVSILGQSSRSVSYQPDPTVHVKINPNKANKISPSKRPLSRDPIPPPTITPEDLKTRAYAVRRTPFGQLPLYRDWKSGNTQILVRVKKVNGDKQLLAREITEKLGIEKERVNINPTTGHIHVKVRLVRGDGLVPTLARSRCGRGEQRRDANESCRATTMSD